MVFPLLTCWKDPNATVALSDSINAFKFCNRTFVILNICIKNWSLFRLLPFVFLPQFPIHPWLDVLLLRRRIFTLACSQMLSSSLHSLLILTAIVKLSLLRPVSPFRSFCVVNNKCLIFNTSLLELAARRCAVSSAWALSFLDASRSSSLSLSLFFQVAVRLRDYGSILPVVSLRDCTVRILYSMFLSIDLA